MHNVGVVARTRVDDGRERLRAARAAQTRVADSAADRDVRRELSREPCLADARPALRRTPSARARGGPASTCLEAT